MTAADEHLHKPIVIVFIIIAAASVQDIPVVFRLSPSLSFFFCLSDKVKKKEKTTMMVADGRIHKPIVFIIISASVQDIFVFSTLLLSLSLSPNKVNYIKTNKQTTNTMKVADGHIHKPIVFIIFLHQSKIHLFFDSPSVSFSVSLINLNI